MQCSNLVIDDNIWMAEPNCSLDDQFHMWHFHALMMYLILLSMAGFATILCIVFVAFTRMISSKGKKHSNCLNSRSGKIYQRSKHFMSIRFRYGPL